MLALWNIAQNWLSMHSGPDQIVVLTRVFEENVLCGEFGHIW